MHKKNRERGVKEMGKEVERRYNSKKKKSWEKCSKKDGKRRESADVGFPGAYILGKALNELHERPGA